MDQVNDMKTVFGIVFLALALVGLGPATSHGQGYGGAVAVIGGEVVVGFPNCGGATGGCVYSYTKNGGEWTETGAVVSPDASADDGFGRSLAAAGGRLLVVAANPNDGEAGRIHVFSRTADGWVPEGTIVPEGLPAGALLQGVVFSGELAAATVSIRPEPPASPGDGAVLVFRDTGDGWAQEALLESPFNRRSRFGGLARPGRRDAGGRRVPGRGACGCGLCL